MLLEKMEKYGRGIAAALCLLAAVAVSTAGCAREPEEPVIAERTGAAAESENAAGSEAVSGSENAAGSEAVTGSEAGNVTGSGAAAGSGELVPDHSGNQDEGSQPWSGRKTLAQQTEAPERYQAQVSGEQVEISADAPVLVPVAQEAPGQAVTRAVPYAPEDFEAFKKAVGQAEGIAWGENQFNKEKGGGYTSCTSDDQKYYVSFRDKGDVPFIWLNSRRISYGSGNGSDAGDLSGMKMDDSGRSRLEKELTGKAESLLKDLGLGDFRQMQVKWRALSESKGAGWTPDGRYALVMRYCKTANGILEPVNQMAVFGEVPPDAQYVDIVYADDGQLIELKDINHVQYGETVETSDFLLPFSAVTEIFEQYVKSYYSIHIPGYVPQQEDQLIVSEKSRDSKTCAYVRLSGVKLEYRAAYPDTEGENQSGRLEPVWNFYGGITVGYRDADGTDSGVTRAGLTAEDDMLLVSINAADGRVYGR